MYASSPLGGGLTNGNRQRVRPRQDAEALDAVRDVDLSRLGHTDMQVKDTDESDDSDEEEDDEGSGTDAESDSRYTSRMPFLCRITMTGRVPYTSTSPSCDSDLTRNTDRFECPIHSSCLILIETREIHHVRSY